MQSKRELTQTEFLNLLSFLDPDPERAGEKYVLIRRGLVRIFACRGCFEAGDLADETMNRVALKAEFLAKNYTGDPMYYFIGVAKKVYLEYQRKRPSFVPLTLHSLELSVPEPTDELKFACLERCMQQLSLAEREIIWHYYQAGATAAQRGILAKRLGFKLGTLRVKIFRLTSLLEECINKCIKDGDAK